jgi:hypothetical protein
VVQCRSRAALWCPTPNVSPSLRPYLRGRSQAHCPAKKIGSIQIIKKNHGLVHSPPCLCGMGLDTSSQDSVVRQQCLRPGMLLTSVLLSCIMGIAPAYSAVEYVSPSVEQIQAMAKPFKKQEVNKGRVWLLFVLGASSLFGVTVLVENNGAWFPAISKANKAMKASMKAMEERERQSVLTGQAASLNDDAYLAQDIEDPLQNAVLAGIKQASNDAKKTLSSMKEDMPREIGIDDDDIGSLLDDAFEQEVDQDDIEDTLEGEEEEEDKQEEEEEAQRTPLFEISGEEIDQSIESRNEASRVEDGGDDDIDLSNISLEDLQKELEKRKNRQT